MSTPGTPLDTPLHEYALLPKEKVINSTSVFAVRDPTLNLLESKAGYSISTIL